MYTLYFIALIPLIAGLVMFIKNRSINIWEWIGSSIIAFIIAGIFHIIAVKGMTDDVETWSGRITSIRQFSEWQEAYEEAIYRTETYTTTDSEGNVETHTREVFDHWEDRTRWHREHHEAYSDINTEYSIGKPEYEKLVKLFGEVHPVKGVRTTWEHSSHMIAGDKNDYVSTPVSGFIYPITDLRHFENRIKAAPSTFSFIKVPTNISVFSYPKNANWRQSDRLIGEAKKLIDIKLFDDMNARLGPAKKVNVIMIGFKNQDTIMGNWQEAKFIGGKKNDVVICFNISGTNTTWAKTFGWTDRKIVNANIDTIVLNNPINNTILPKIEQEIKKNYMLKDWNSFSYITIDPPPWCIWVYVLVMCIVQGGLWFWFHINEFDRDDDRSGGIYFNPNQ